MGGMIASLLAAMYPVDKLVLLSAAAYYLNPKQMASEIKSMIVDTFKGNLNNNELFLRYKRKIKGTPITATLQFRRLSFLYQTSTATNRNANVDCAGRVRWDCTAQKC